MQISSLIYCIAALLWVSGGLIAYVGEIILVFWFIWETISENVKEKTFDGFGIFQISYVSVFFALFVSWHNWKLISGIIPLIFGLIFLTIIGLKRLAEKWLDDLANEAC